MPIDLLAANGLNLYQEQHGQEMTVISFSQQITGLVMEI